MKVDSIRPEYGNQLIADFIKEPVLPYHEDWSLLMALVLYLEDKDVAIKIYYRNCAVEWNDEDDGYEVETGIQGDTKIEAVWTAIVLFLDWVKTSQIDLDNPTFYD